MDEKSKDLAQVDENASGLNVTTGNESNVPVVSPADTQAATAHGPVKTGGLAAADGGTNTALGRPIARPRRPAPKRRASPWGWLFIILLAIAAGVGTFFYVRSTQKFEGFQGQTTTASTRTPITVSLASNGQIAANADLGVTFATGGNITELDKKVGDKVNVGDVLGKIDDTDLQLSVKSAQDSFDQAQANYNKSVAGATKEDLANAQAQVDAANANLDKTVKGTYTADDIASANASVASAAAKLQQDRQGGTPYDFASAQSSLSSAQANLASAQAKLAKDQAGPDNATVVQAQTSVTTAQASLDQAKASQTKTLSSLQLTIVNAQVARDQALNALKDAQAAYNKAYWNNRNPDGTLKANLSQSSIDAETSSYEAVQNAQGNYNKSDIALNDANTQQSTQIATLQSQITSAQANLVNAQAQLDKTLQGSTSADILADQASVSSAQSGVDSAKKAQAALTPTQSTIASDEASLSSAQDNLSKMHGGTPDDIAASQASVTQAQNALVVLQAGPDSNDIAIAKAQLDVAQTSLDKAKLSAADAILKSPIAGTIAQAPLTVGQAAAASTVVYQIVDTSSFHVDVNVAETDISKLVVGTPVAVNLDGVPNHSFTGKITFISSKATVTSNVVSYLTTVTLDPTGTNSLQAAYQSQFAKLIPTRQGGTGAAAGGTGTAAAGGQAQGGTRGGTGNFSAAGGAALAASTGICGYNIASLFGQNNAAATAQNTPKVGMSANVTFCLNLEAGVLSVPSRAIKTKVANGQRVSYVTVLVDRNTNKTQDVPVLTGLVGDTSTEVTGGDLKDGDTIVLSTVGATTGTTGAAAGGFGAGGFGAAGGGGAAGGFGGGGR